MIDLQIGTAKIRNTIKHTRITMGMSQSTLSKKTGLCQATISKIENGEVPVSIENAMIIFAALGYKTSVWNDQRINKPFLRAE